MKNILFSKRAASKLQKLLDYLEQEWSDKVKHNFILKLDRTLKNVSAVPESCEESTVKKGLFKCAITKQTTIFYRYNSISITVVTLFDNRMNPEKLRKDL